MLQLFFIYFALPSLGVSLDVFVAVAIGYILNMAAYETEIIRSGIESIEKGQYEAAKALGMTYRQTMQKVILPQIIRRVLPATCSETIILLKDTSLASVVGVGELLRNTKELFNLDINIIVFFVTFLIYLFLSSILVQLFSHLEKKYSIYE
ncbi:MAG: amino acid ABC transporter permease, partial [Clostridiales bacterium]